MFAKIFFHAGELIPAWLNRGETQLVCATPPLWLLRRRARGNGQRKRASAQPESHPPGLQSFPPLQTKGDTDSVELQGPPGASTETIVGCFRASFRDIRADAPVRPWPQGSAPHQDDLLAASELPGCPAAPHVP